MRENVDGAERGYAASPAVQELNNQLRSLIARTERRRDKGPFRRILGFSWTQPRDELATLKWDLSIRGHLRDDLIECILRTYVSEGMYLKVVDFFANVVTSSFWATSTQHRWASMVSFRGNYESVSAWMLRR